MSDVRAMRLRTLIFLASFKPLWWSRAGMVVDRRSQKSSAMLLSVAGSEIFSCFFFDTDFFKDASTSRACHGTTNCEKRNILRLPRSRAHTPQDTQALTHTWRGYPIRIHHPHDFRHGHPAANQLPHTLNTRTIRQPKRQPSHMVASLRRGSKRKDCAPQARRRHASRAHSEPVRSAHLRGEGALKHLE